MTLLYIVATIAVICILAVALWFIMQDPSVVATSNYATRDEQNPLNYPRY